MNNIGIIIQSLRKEKNINQEQLANAIGVSVAAVSKWETCSSYPDITLLAPIAEYFDVSIDVLMGHEVRNGALDKYKVKVNEYMIVADYYNAIPLLEQALKKYPNDFGLNNDMGSAMMYKCTAVNPVNIEIANESLKYFKKALDLHTDKCSNTKSSIYNHMIHLYISIGEYDKAIDLIENTNEKLVDQSRLAECYKKKGDIAKAKLLLQNDLFNIAFGFASLTGNLADCYVEEGNTQKPIELQKIHAIFMQFFTQETPNYCDIICSWSFGALAKKYININDIDNMWDCLDNAVYHAVRFDKAPSYNMNDINFCDGTNGYISSNSASNACNDLIKTMENDFKEFANTQKYKELLSKLKEAATDKKNNGIWE